MRSPLLYLGVTVVLVLFAALIAPMFIDWSNYRAQLESYGSHIAGRDVRIEGPVRIQILPTPVISVSGLRIANAPGASVETFVSADSLELRLALSPLLKGKIEVTSLDFEGATFEFEHMKDTGGNWNFSPKAVLADFLSLENIGVASATISDSVIVLRDHTRGGTARLEDVFLEIAAASLAGPYRVRGTVTHEEKLLYVSLQTGRRVGAGDMRFSLTLEPDGEYTPTYGFDGKFTGAGADARLDGKLRISRDLPQLVEDALPLDPAEVGLPFSFKAVVDAGFSEISLSGIEFLVDQAQPGSVIEGQVHITLGDVLGLDVDLNARHFDLDRLADRSGLTPADLVPGLAFVNTIADLVGAAPDDLKGGIRLAANALTIGGETVEAAEIRAVVTGKTLTFSHVGGVLPGRSEVELSGLTFAVRSGIPGFEGDVRLASRDTRAFLTWALPDIANGLAAAPRAFRGKATVTGKIAIDSRSVGIRQALLEVDGTTAQGAVVVVPGDRPEILGNVVLANVDFDRYLTVSTENNVPDASNDPFAALVAGISPKVLSAFNGKFVFESGAFRRWRLTGEALKASLEVRDGALILQQANIRGFNGADFELVGAVDWRGGTPHGSLTADLKSESAGRLFEIPPIRRLKLANNKLASILFRETTPVNLHIDLDSERVDGASRIAATVEGDVDRAKIQLTAAYKGDWASFELGSLKLDGTVSSDGNDMFMRLLGLEPPAAVAGDGDASTLSVSLSGSLAKGIGGALVVNSFDARLDVSGLMTQSGDTLSVDSEVTLKSDDASKLFQALGLLPDGEPAVPVPVDLKGLVSGGDGEFIITGLGGRISAIPVGLDGTIELAGAQPKLYGNLTVAKVDLPWVVARLLSQRSGPPQDRQGDQRVPGTAWSAAPFDFSLLKAIDLNLAVRAGDVTLLGGASGAQMQADVTVTQGAVNVEHFKSAFAGGQLNADARLSAVNGQLSMQAEFTLQDAGFASTLGSPDGQAPLSGRYELAGTLKGIGRSPIGFMSSLTGAGTLTIDDAALFGINPVSFSQALEQATSASELDGIIRDTLVDGQMTFAGLTSAFEVSNGVARFEPADIESPAATGSVRGMLDLPSWRLDSKWTIALKTFPTAPPLTVLLAGPAAEPVRTYDTAALRSFFVVKGLTEGVQQLEELQREEQERIKRLEEMEKEAKLQAERREAKRREAERLLAERLLAEERRKAEEAEWAALEAEARRKAEADRLARQKRANAPDPAETPNDAKPAHTGVITQPNVAVPLPPAPRTKPKSTKIISRIPPEPSSTDQLPLPEQLPEPEQLQPLNQPLVKDYDVDILALDPIDPDAEDLEDGPVDITPGGRTPAAQESLFSDDPASWRK